MCCAVDGCASGSESDEPEGACGSTLNLIWMYVKWEREREGAREGGE